MKGAILAVDWGTTNRRVYRLSADGRVEATERDARGIKAVAPGGYAAEAAGLRARFGDLPMVCAGMVGSNRGWVEAPYLELPAGLPDLAAAAVWVDPGRTAIIPGICRRDPERPDVMRGEDVQFLGVKAGDEVLLCQPGTHCKWARVETGMIVEFTTAMTGELFALLREHSLLAPQLGGAVEPGKAFRQGVTDGARGDLLGGLFRVRAASLLKYRDDADAAAYTSGLVIGADVGARIADGAREVAVLADPGLGDLYASAVETLGGSATVHDSHTAFVAGITQLWNLMA